VVCAEQLIAYNPKNVLVNRPREFLVPALSHIRGSGRFFRTGRNVSPNLVNDLTSSRVYALDKPCHKQVKWAHVRLFDIMTNPSLHS
jgi:hypothetical protein